MNLRQDQATGTGGMCETLDENRNAVVEELRKTLSQTGSFNPEAIGEVPLREEQKWMDKLLEGAEVSRATRKLANGRFGGNAELHGEYYKALGKGPENAGLPQGGARRVFEIGPGCGAYAPTLA
jgi:hypothetical protein